MVVTLIAVIAGTFTATPIYSATATLRIATGAAGTVEYSDYMYAERLLNTYKQIATSSPILDQLKQRLGLADTPKIEVKILSGTELIQIYVEHDDPIMAAKIANTLAEIIITGLEGGLRTRSLYLVEPAATPLTPTKPKKVLNIGLGIIVGLIGGLGLIFLFENLDSTLYTTEQIEELTKLPNLGVVPNTNFNKGRISTNGNNPFTDAFRRVRTNILRLDTNKALCSILITSSRPGEGKSRLVSEIAIALSHSGYKVIIVDGDLHLPTQHQIFELPNDQGLSNVLMQQIDLEKAIQESKIPGLQILTSGPLPPHPTELLDSSQMREIIDQLHKNHDFIIVDTPALLEVSDTTILAPQMDGVILVVSRANSRREDLVTTRKQLEIIKARMIGFIVNRAEQERGYYYYKRRKTIPLNKLSDK
jgi:capsular exopolysaccharide synthesis family protein